jgi:hypothetical protein
MKKPIISSFIVAWALLDPPTLAGTLIFATGLATAAYIWGRWGASGNESCHANRNK